MGYISKAAVSSMLGSMGCAIGKEKAEFGDNITGIPVFDTNGQTVGYISGNGRKTFYTLIESDIVESIAHTLRGKGIVSTVRKIQV